MPEPEVDLRSFIRQHLQETYPEASDEWVENCVKSFSCRIAHAAELLGATISESVESMEKESRELD